MYLANRTFLYDQSDCIIEALGNPQKERMKHEDTNISHWLQGNQCSPFSRESMYRKKNGVEIFPLQNDEAKGLLRRKCGGGVPFLCKNNEAKN